VSNTAVRSSSLVLVISPVVIWLAFSFLLVPAAVAQPRPYIGYVYPAGGQQGTTIQTRLGGQALDGVNGVLLNGAGVTGRVVQYYWRLNNEELRLLNEELRRLRRETMSASARADLMQEENTMMMSDLSDNRPVPSAQGPAQVPRKEAVRKMIDKIEQRTAEFVQTPASAAIASLVMVEVTISPDAEPGERDVRLVTSRGVSNPLPFHVGQFPERSKKPMVTASQQILGKEAQALRQQLPGANQERITLPCTANGQIGSGEVHRYQFDARRGQRLVLTALGRQLVPFIADAVPGWFQPVLALYDSDHKELAYGDDYRFKPDPTIFYEIPRDGEYEFTIRDSLYRGREDFVYRVTIGELPFITSVFPLGGQVRGLPERGSASEGSTPSTESTPLTSSSKPHVLGWNLEDAEISSLPTNVPPGTYRIAVNRKGTNSNPVPFALDTLPEAVEREPNNSPASAQEVTLPVIINGRIGKPDDWDVFRFVGKSNDIIVAEVQARRLDSPLDSILKLTDATGSLVAFNDDHEDPSAGVNTHHADSYLMVRLPADGPYFVHLGDTARQGGEEYGYRLRLSAPQPDFSLRVVPSSLSLRSRSSASLTVYALRRDGFDGPIKVSLNETPAGFSASSITLASTQTVGRLNVRTDLVSTEHPVTLSIKGSAKLGDRDRVHEAVPCEDKMQAFLWRHLLPARDLKVLVFDPSQQPPTRRFARARPPKVAVTNSPVVVASTAATNSPTTSTNSAVDKPKFTKQQVESRLRQLKRLFEEGLLTDDFYEEKVAECEAAE
jgi:hypothetical protein